MNVSHLQTHAKSPIPAFHFSTDSDWRPDILISTQMPSKAESETCQVESETGPSPTTSFLKQTWPGSSFKIDREPDRVTLVTLVTVTITVTITVTLLTWKN